jgi:hypothetical protein
MVFKTKIEEVFHKLKYELAGSKSVINDFEELYQSNKMTPEARIKNNNDADNKILAHYIEAYATQEGLNPVNAVSIVEGFKNSEWFRDDSKFRKQIIDNYKSIVESDTVRYLNNSEQKYHEYYQYILTIRSETILSIVSAIESMPTNSPKVKKQIDRDFTISTIHEYLEDFKSFISKDDYEIFVSALMEYFENGSFPELTDIIQVNGKISKKKFGWALNKIFKSKNQGVTKELLQFAKQHISLFKDVQFDESKFLRSNLYKYFTTDMSK